MLVYYIYRLSKKKNTRLVSVSMETVHIAKFWPKKNQSERSDLRCVYLAML